MSLRGVFMKMSEIQQSDDAEKLALAYNDNGAFHVKVITRKEVTKMDRAGVEQVYPPGGVISDIVVN